MKLTASNFEKEIIDLDGLAVVDFSATWCGICERMKPVFEEFTNDYKGRVVVGEVTIDESEVLAAEFEIEVIPTFIFFKAGKEVDRISGKVEKLVLSEIANKLLGVSQNN